MSSIRKTPDSAEQTTQNKRQTDVLYPLKHTWRAIAPTMLDILGIDVPDDMSNERLGS